MIFYIAPVSYVLLICFSHNLFAENNPTSTKRPTRLLTSLYDWLCVSSPLLFLSYVFSASLLCHSVTAPIGPATNDGEYYHVPFKENKPCLYLRCKYEDHRPRMFLPNIMDKVREAFVSSYPRAPLWSLKLQKRRQDTQAEFYGFLCDLEPAEKQRHFAFHLKIDGIVITAWIFENAVLRLNFAINKKRMD